jgi:hypothetical protein
MTLITDNDSALRAGREFIDQLSNDLVNGDSRLLQRFLEALSDHHEFGYFNVILIMLQSPKALKVATAETWARLERSVRNQAQGILILAPMRVIGHSDPDQLTDAHGRLPSNSFATRTAFDIRDTRGAPYPWSIVDRGQFHFAIGGLRDMIVHEEGLRISKTCGNPIGYRDGCLSIASELPQNEELLALAQGLSMHLLGKGMGGIEIPPHVREIEAQMVAHVVALGTGLRDSEACLLEATAIATERSQLARSLSRVQRVAHSILDYIMLDGMEV